jgi:SAM-dependent methyltransferase/acyl carrier protein
MLGIDRKIGQLPKASFAQSTAPQVQIIKKLPQEDLFAIVAEYAAIDSSSITSSASLEDLGVDSLSLIELKSALEDTYSVDLDFEVSTTVGELLSMLGTNPDPAPEPTSVQQAQPLKSPALLSSTPYSSTVRLRDPIEALEECKNIFSASAQNCGLTGYCKIVKPRQDKLVLAYIAEAFKELGSDLQSLRCGETVPTFQYLAKHSYLVPRLWDILTEAKIVEKCGSSHVRSSGALPSQASDVLLGEMLAAYPQWVLDNKILSITGSKLAKCLTGKADAVKLLFGDATCKDLLASFYSGSPLFKPAEDILLKIIDRVVPAGTQIPFRILEVGAGTGATTALLADFLQKNGRKVEYTFTDISSTLVTSSKKRFSNYKWMDFRTLDLEKRTPADMLGKYDLALGTNVVHATADVTQSCTSIKSLLKEDGFLILLELTKNLNWFDLVFGLLTGWWGATDGRTHALSTAETWSTYFKNSGFSSFGASGLSTEDSLIQQVLVGSTVPSKSNRYPNSKRYTLETVPYKVVDDLQIEADIYYPTQPNSSKAMPIGNSRLC